MDLKRVESSMIYAAGYDPDAHALEVVFNTGGIYRYLRVPKKVFDELLAADSQGQYMRANVIDVYPYERLGRRRISGQAKASLLRGRRRDYSRGRNRSHIRGRYRS